MLNLTHFFILLLTGFLKDTDSGKPFLVHFSPGDIGFQNIWNEEVVYSLGFYLMLRFIAVHNGFAAV